MGMRLFLNTTLWSWAFAVAVTNSITLWNEQPVLVGRMRPRVRGIFRSRNVSHFHESWRNSVIVGRLSMSIWFVCLTPPFSYFSHSSSIWIVTFSNCILLRSCLCLRGWNQSHLTATCTAIKRKSLKIKINQNSFLWSLQCRSSQLVAKIIYWDALNAMKWCHVVMAIIYTTPCTSTIWVVKCNCLLRNVRYSWEWIETNTELAQGDDQK